MTAVDAQRRLHLAEQALAEAEASGARRDAAAWRIAVEVLRHFAVRTPSS